MKSAALVAFGSAGAATQGGVVCLPFVHCALSGGNVDVGTGSPMRLVWMLRSVQSSAGDMTFTGVWIAVNVARTYLDRV